MSTRKAATAWLFEQLVAGAVLAREILARGRELGHSERTLKRAKATLGVVSRKARTANGEWIWALALFEEVVPHHGHRSETREDSDQLNRRGGVELRVVEECQREADATPGARCSDLEGHSDREPTPSLSPRPCPNCRRPTDDRGRCWECLDWICACGRLTGSNLISMCWLCQCEEERHSRPESPAPARGRVGYDTPAPE
jgi:hypothetical protein